MRCKPLFLWAAVLVLVQMLQSQHAASGWRSSRKAQPTSASSSAGEGVCRLLERNLCGIARSKGHQHDSQASLVSVHVAASR